MRALKLISFCFILFLFGGAKAQEANFYGSPNISIPLYTLRNSDITIPIYLQYNSNGIKVEEEASNIGLGWTLFTGGEIKRIVRGVPDDYFMNDNNNMGVGWIHVLDQTETWVKSLFGVTIWSTTICSFHSTPASFIDRLTPEVYTPSGMYKGFNIIRNYWLDTEPDVFSFSIPGNSGRFYFNKNGVIVSESNYNLKFTYSLSSDKRIDNITIVDDKGIQYVFSEKDTKQISYSGKDKYTLSYGRSRVPFEASSLTTSYTEGWHLSQVLSPSGNKIEYQYEIESNLNYPKIPKSKQVSDTEEKSEFENISEVNITKRIRKIISNDFEVVFNKGAKRKDLFSTYPFSSYPISEIKYYWKNSANGFKGYSLNQSYFDSDNCFPLFFYNCKRLKLNSITEFGLNCSKTDMTFSYNEQDKLPSKKSTEQDLWGYYNMNGSTSLIPRIFIYNNLTHDKFRVIQKPNQNSYIETSGANRQPDIRLVNGKIETVMDAFILQQINLPEGGSIKYEFEPHEYLYENDIYRGGGLRIKKIINDNNDGNPYNDIVKEFSYTDQNGLSSGRLIEIPIYAYTFFNEGDANSLGKVDDIYNNHRNEYYSKYTKVTSYPSNFLIDQPITYSNVEVKQNNLGKTRYTFSNGYLFEDFNAPFKTKITHNLVECWYPGINELDYPSVCQSGDDIACFFKDSPETLPNKDCFPFPSNENSSWDRGQVTKIEVFNSNGKPVKSTDFIWSNIYNSSTHPEYIIALKSEHFFHIWYARRCAERNWPWRWLGDICPPSCSSGNPQYAYGRYKIATGISKKVTSMIEKTYNPFDETKYSTLVKNYTYTTDNLLSSEEIVNSDGGKQKTQFRYLNDVYTYNGSHFNELSMAFVIMKNKHLISIPVEIIKYKDDKVIASELQLYKPVSLFNAFPFVRYTFESGSPILSTTYKFYNFGNTYPIIIDPNLKPKIYFDKYDDKGNIIQLHKVGDINNSFIWGYNKTQPIAEIKNAKADEIYYNGYEEGTNLYTSDAHTGKSCMMINNSNQFAGTQIFDKTVLTSGKYVYSAWFKTTGSASLVVKDKIDQVPWIPKTVGSTNGEWKYYEMVVDINSSDFNGCTQVAIEVYNPSTTPVYVDDVRFKPLNSQMTTYTYNPLAGISSVTDNLNRTTSYDYDCLGRLQTTKDESGYILSHNEYSNSVNVSTSPQHSPPVNPEPYVLNALPIGNNNYNLFLSGEDFYCDNYSYNWNFGDGTTLTDTTCNLSHQFPVNSNSSYTVTVTIYRGSQIVNALSVNCIGLGSCVLTSNQSGTCNFNYNLTGSGFNGSNFTYEWNFGDGTVISNSLWSMSHPFNDPTIEHTVFVKILYNGIPVKTLFTSCNCLGSITLMANQSGQCSNDFYISGSYFNSNDYTYDWDFGDGQTLYNSTSTNSHFYNQFGVYTVTVDVKYQGVAVKTLQISVECVDSGGGYQLQ